MTFDEIYTGFEAELLAQYAEGGYEPDGIGLATGVRADNDPLQLGFGRDLSCVTDCTPEMAEVDPYSAQAVGEALARLLSTPQGGIISDPTLLTAVGEDPHYGFDLAGMLHVDTDELRLRAYQDLATAACQRDERVQSVTVTIDRVGPDGLNVFVYGVTKTGVTFEKVLPLTTASLEQVLNA